MLLNLWNSRVQCAAVILFAIGFSTLLLHRNLVKKIVFEEGIQSTAVRGFEYFQNLEEIVLPSTMKKINLNSFAHCPKLKTVNFPEGLTEIGDFAFYECSSLTSITIPSSVTNSASH